MAARSPLGEVRGLGSARSGTGDYQKQKMVSWALLPLTVFFIGLLIALAGADHVTVAASLANPLVALPLLLFILANAIHMRLGMQQVIEDYVHSKGPKSACTMANSFFCYACGAIAAFALLRLSFMGWPA